MFCPQCAAQNLDGASYCRVCGANISLVPQALTGQLPSAEEEALSRSDQRTLKRHGRASLDNAFRNAFMGVAFLLISMALAFSPMGRAWWFWMLIPAFSLMGTGVAQYIRIKEEQKRAMMGERVQPFQPAMQSPPRVNSFPRRNTGELVPTPPSVTEGTTRHLGTEAPTRHLEASTEPPK
ncbi:MAG: zinc ribbon domain-containing protein [Pyrinomonadaceae bacterium]